MEPQEHRPRYDRVLQEQIAIYQELTEALPKMMALAEALDNDVLRAAVLVMQTEHFTMQARWTGQL